jgi:hypothetical protein
VGVAESTVYSMNRRAVAVAAIMLSLVTLGVSRAQSAHGATNSDQLASLRVEPEHRGGYQRSLFPHWDKLANGCTVREQVLIHESLINATVAKSGCRVVSGEWFSPYDNTRYYDPTYIEIDHVVALAEAWDSGAWSWSATKRRAFANDLVSTVTLRAVSGVSNQAKSAKDPSEWLPAVEFRCTYVREWVSIKARWGLSVDARERDVIKSALSKCPAVT